MLPGIASSSRVREREREVLLFAQCITCLATFSLFGILAGDVIIIEPHVGVVEREGRLVHGCGGVLQVFAEPSLSGEYNLRYGKCIELKRYMKNRDWQGSVAL